MNKLRAYLLLLYGEKMKDAIGDDRIWQGWARQLEGFGLEAAKRAVDEYMLGDQGHFPPRLADLLRLCNRPMAMRAPRDDAEFHRWALSHGYGDARPGESFASYRARICQQQKQRLIAGSTEEATKMIEAHGTGVTKI